MEKIVIIGSGIGGLSCGALLASAGYQVTVVEKHFCPGGYISNFARKGTDGNRINCDASLHGIGNLKKGRHLYDTFDKLNVWDSAKPIRKLETATLVTKDTEITIPDDFEEYKNTLIKLFPNFKQGIENLFDYIWEFNIAIEQDLYLNNNMPDQFKELESLSLYEFVAKYVDDEKFIEIFSFLWAYYGLPSKKLNSLYYMLAWISYHIGGTSYIKGGSQALSNALVEVIKRNGGQIILSQEIVSIHTKDNNITHIKAKKGMQIVGDIFIFNGCPQNLLPMIDNTDLSKQEMTVFEGRPISISFSQLYIGLDCNPAELGVVKSDYYFKFNETSEKSYNCALKGDYEKSDFTLLNYNLLDKDLNKDGGLLTITIPDLLVNWPKYDTKEYRLKKENLSKLLLEKLYKAFPQIKDHVTFTELGTPATMKRYTNNHEGAVYGFAQDLENSVLKRPYNKSNNFINLYYSSAWSQPGGGVEGVMMAGIGTYNVILKNQNLKSTPQVHSDNSNSNIMSPNLFMKGMAFNLNKEKAAGINIVYKFNFTDINKIYLMEVNNGKARVLKTDKANFNLTVHCTYDTWYKISNNLLDGEQAYRSGLLKVDGKLNEFLLIPKIFKTRDANKPAPEKPVYKLATLYIPITLIPWILYWAGEHFLSPVLIGFFALFFTVIVQYFFKPKPMRHVTNLEATTLICFTLYLFLYFTNTSLFDNYAHYINLILPLSLLISCLAEPMTAQYAKWAYPSEIVETKLFRVVNVNITLVWVAVFVLQFIFVFFIFSFTPLGSIFYALNLIGILFSYIYPILVMK